jgi:uncharacterized protein (UPF0335 family)
MSDQPEAVTLDLLGRLVREIQAEQRATREQRREEVTVLRALVDRVGRVDRHIAELRDDLELMIRSELMGQLGHLRTETEQNLDALAERVEALERRMPLS